jgi:hypothetical protein
MSRLHAHADVGMAPKAKARTAWTLDCGKLVILPELGGLSMARKGAICEGNFLSRFDS